MRAETICLKHDSDGQIPNLSSGRSTTLNLRNVNECDIYLLKAIYNSIRRPKKMSSSKTKKKRKVSKIRDESENENERKSADAKRHSRCQRRPHPQPTVVTRSQTKQQKQVQEEIPIRGEDFVLPRDILIKVLGYLETLCLGDWLEIFNDRLSLLAFSLACKSFKEVKDEVDPPKVAKAAYDRGIRFDGVRLIFGEDYAISTCTVHLTSGDPVPVTGGWIRWVYQLLVAEGKDIKEVDKRDFLLNIAALNGHLEEVKWLRGKGFALTPWTCSQAAGGGHLKLLKWLRREGCPWDESTCSSAAGGGHLKVLKWARSKGCPLDTETCNLCQSAAKEGHLKMLKWARSEGCPWDEWTCSYAAEGGHLKVLQWLRSEGCPWGELTCTNAAGECAKSNNPELVNWLIAQQCPGYEKLADRLRD